MMVISLHDRISSHANRVRVLERFLAYAKSKPGVWFAHKDEIAKWAVVSIGRSRRSTTAARRRSAALPVRWPDQAVILPFTMSRISRETEHSDALTFIRR